MLGLGSGFYRVLDRVTIVFRISVRFRVWGIVTDRVTMLFRVRVWFPLNTMEGCKEIFS